MPKARKAKSTLKIGGRNYKKISCSTTKGGATKKAKSLRSAGKTATVRKQGKAYCVFSAGNRKRRKKRA